MTNEQARIAAQTWHGQAGGRLCPQLTENELAGLVNEAIHAAAQQSAMTGFIAGLDLVAEVVESTKKKAQEKL